MRAWLAIVVWTVFLAMCYGIVHDQITARICVEYFTIGHPRLIDTDSPTLLGLFWGVVATWCAGAIMGVPLACAARLGRKPKWSVRQLVRPSLVLIASMGVAAVIAGCIGYVLAKNGAIVLVPPLAQSVPADSHVAFIADGAAHLASYAAGLIGGIALCIYVWRARRRGA